MKTDSRVQRLIEEGLLHVLWTAGKPFVPSFVDVKKADRVSLFMSVLLILGERDFS